MLLNNPQAVYVQRGEVIDYTNTGLVDLKAADIVELTGRIGVAGTDIPVGVVGSIHVTGVFDVPATNTEAFTVGQPVYWDGTAVVSVATDNTLAGWVVAPKLSVGTIARVKIG